MRIRIDEYSSEKDLLTATKLGDRQAFEILLNRSNTALKKLLYLKITNPDSREELQQDIKLAAFASIKNFRGDSQFKTWLLRIANNHIFNYYRQRRRAVQISLEDISENNLEVSIVSSDVSYGDPVKIILLNEENDEIIKAIHNCGARFKHLLVLKLIYVHHLSIQEVAENLHLTEGNITVILSRTKEKLSKELEKRKQLGLL